MLKTLSRTSEAIEALVDFLDISPSDPEAWLELAELYVETSLFSQAQFCFEEVLTIVPTAWNVRSPHIYSLTCNQADRPQLHARMGEVLYISAMNSSESTVIKNLAESLRRFCRSVELCDDYLRGFYGLKMVRLLPPPNHTGEAELSSGI